jgi:hypothetical protein
MPLRKVLVRTSASRVQGTDRYAITDGKGFGHELTDRFMP